MQAVAMGRMLRMLRIRRGWRQLDVSTKAGLSAAAIGRHENGLVGSMRALERHASVFSLRVDVRLAGRSGEVARLADEEHAAIAERIATRLRGLGLAVDVEVSFSEWGERGRFDLLAYDPRAQKLLAIEVKTLLVDLQELFGALDAKQRLATTVAAKRGWTVQRTLTVLAVASTIANRATVRTHPTLFGRFIPRRLSATLVGGTDDRSLVWISARDGDRQGWLAGRQRVRQTKRPQLSARAAYAPSDGETGPPLEVPLTGREMGAWTGRGRS